ncbi:hypothetical protein [Terrabacter terrigena]|uniref:Uncharacterized protein n=1 Tax=Terrabacter terrigena TaxID=574718 RepID=A0ABW3MXM2_9MICO
MSRYSGWQGAGAARRAREQRRREAEARNALTPPERRASARRPCPSGKRKLTEHQAQCELVGATVDRNRGRVHRRERRAYQCPLCGAHHLTSKPQKKRRERKEAAA